MITVNGRPVEHRANETASALLARMGYVFPLIVVRMNGRIVPSESLGETAVPDGATIEVVHLTSGG